MSTVPPKSDAHHERNLHAVTQLKLTRAERRLKKLRDAARVVVDAKVELEFEAAVLGLRAVLTADDEIEKRDAEREAKEKK